MGKVGAVSAAAWIVNLHPRDVFLVSALWAGVGLAVTWLLLPDTTGLDLHALDEFHRCVMAGERSSYVGPATAAKHLSPVERWVLGWGQGQGHGHGQGGGSDGDGGPAKPAGGEIESPMHQRNIA